MQIKKLTLSTMGTNVYLIETERELIVIDPADEADKIFEYADMVGKPISYALVTHGHFDHCNAALELQKRGAKIFMSALDFDMIKNGFDLAKYCNVKFNFFQPDNFISDGELNLCGLKIFVISTPGHTAGSLTFIIDDNIFCGDVLFYRSVGRTDLPTGNSNELIRSIKKLYTFDGTVYPGHGAQTSLEFERKNNPYVKA